jgi:RNA polymerase sigma-70 factor (ECF subfamily)
MRDQAQKLASVPDHLPVEDGPVSLNTADLEKPAGLEEAELIRRIVAGEKELYYDLLVPYQRPVYLIALSVLRNEADAEDCMQEAILKAYRHLSDFRGQCKFGSWLIRITLNQARMMIRKSRPGIYESLDDEIVNENGEYRPPRFADWREIPSEALERKEIREILENAIHHLPDGYRQVFALRDIQGIDIATTAQILGVSEGVVKIRLLRARLRIRDLVAPLVRDSKVLSRPLFTKGKNPWS